MTRERKIAIQMWEEVKEQLPQWSGLHIASCLRYFKHQFCNRHDVNWTCDCWFCQYMHEECECCPLRSCDSIDPTTAWMRIVDEHNTLATRLDACDEIIAALKGERVKRRTRQS